MHTRYCNPPAKSGAMRYSAMQHDMLLLLCPLVPGSALVRASVLVIIKNLVIFFLKFTITTVRWLGITWPSLAGL